MRFANGVWHEKIHSFTGGWGGGGGLGGGGGGGGGWGGGGGGWGGASYINSMTVTSPYSRKRKLKEACARIRNQGEIKSAVAEVKKIARFAFCRGST